MVKNMKLLVSSAFLSSFLVGSVVHANNPIQQDLNDLEGRGIVKQRVNEKEAAEIFGNIENSSEWHIYQAPRLVTDKQIDEYMDIMARQKKAFEEVGEGTYHPEARGYRLQQLGRASKKIASTTWNIIEPAVTYGAVRVGGNIILSYVGPKIVENAGNLAAKAAEDLFKHDYSGFFKKAASKAARATAEGEALRDLGTLTHYVETYGVPTIKTVYKATSTVSSVAYNATKAVYNWGKSWFSGKATQSTAASAV